MRHVWGPGLGICLVCRAICLELGLTPGSSLPLGAPPCPARRRLYSAQVAATVAHRLHILLRQECARLFVLGTELERQRKSPGHPRLVFVALSKLAIRGLGSYPYPHALYPIVCLSIAAFNKL